LRKNILQQQVGVGFISCFNILDGFYKGNRGCRIKDKVKANIFQMFFYSPQVLKLYQHSTQSLFQYISLGNIQSFNLEEPYTVLDRNICLNFLSPFHWCYDSNTVAFITKFTQ